MLNDLSKVIWWFIICIYVHTHWIQLFIVLWTAVYGRIFFQCFFVRKNNDELALRLEHRPLVWTDKNWFIWLLFPFLFFVVNVKNNKKKQFEFSPEIKLFNQMEFFLCHTERNEWNLLLQRWKNALNDNDIVFLLFQSHLNFDPRAFHLLIHVDHRRSIHWIQVFIYYFRWLNRLQREEKKRDTIFVRIDLSFFFFSFQSVVDYHGDDAWFPFNAHERKSNK